MQQKIEICGIELNNQTVEETVQTMESFFSKGRLFVVTYVYAELLKLIAQDEDLRRQVMQSADLILIAEKAVADVLETPCAMTEEEMKMQAVANALLAYCTEQEKTVYWVGETEKSYETFRAYVDKQFTKLQVEGAFATGGEIDIEDEDELINDINRIAPDVIISKLSSPYQEQFIARQKRKVNAQIWLGLSAKANLTSEPLPTSSKLKAMIDRTLLRRVVKASQSVLDKNGQE